ncbi:SH3 domain-containing protein [Streptomyces sp. G44]|uniref:SH3 domain-containing protein n=1 Tax=Streptomyces sp. G44 TaxID=2807632 RepID=UPI00195FF600|nr:SH3 domain-containing protein [Streptomyces sp. G44]MBM7172530.1 SH3 domain-containing protein [Streptomyces sp. G44]
MSLRTTTTRLGVLAATGALAALGLSGPAAALDDPDRKAPAADRKAPAAGHKTPAADRRTPVTDYKAPVYKGRVTAKSGLLLRDSPHRGSRVVRTEPHGKVVTIYCKTKGDRVGRTNHWYLLTDGTWAWGSANYIATIGKNPRWC